MADIIPILQLCIGGGIFILMLRIAVMVGTYTNRLEHLEKAFEKWGERVEDIRRDVQEIRVVMKLRDREDEPR